MLLYIVHNISKRQRFGRKSNVLYRFKIAVLFMPGIDFAFQRGDYLHCCKETHIYLTTIAVNRTLNLHKC